MKRTNTDRHDGPSAEALAEIEREWPLIEAEIALLDAEIALLDAEYRAGDLGWRRLRRAQARVMREFNNFHAAGATSDRPAVAA